MKKRILLVEDNIADARLIREMLHEAGSDRDVLETAGRLSEAITLIREAPFDIVLLDLGLPDSQGLETLNTYLESAAEIPVIVLTGLADEAISVQAVESGAQDYLVKGRIDGPMLFRAIRYAIGRRRQERALRQSEERYRAVAHSATDAIVLADSAGNIVGWNRGAERIFGYSEAEVSGRSVTLLMPFRFHDGHQAGMARIQAGGEPQVVGKIVEMEGLRKDGTEFPLELSLASWQVADSQFYTSIIRDITERKRSTEHVARLHQQNELILCSAAEGILGLDLQGYHTFVNPAAARMLGYEVEELLGRPSHSTWHHTKPDGSPYRVEECQICAAYRNGAVHRVSTEVFWSKDGTSFPVEYMSTPIYEQGRMAGAVLTFTDITERKRVEERKRKAFQLESALLRINTQILEGADTREVMGTACDAIVEMGYRMSWIGRPDPDYIVRPIAYKGFTEGYLENINVRWDDSSEGKGPTGTAIRTGQPCVIQSIRESPIFGPWRENTIRHGYLSMGAFPLISEKGEGIGVLDVYSDREGAFGDEEIGRLGMFVQQCSIALMNARRIESLRDTKQRLAFHVDRMPLAYIVWDPGFGVVEWNPAAERIFGWKANEAIGKRAHELIVPAAAQSHVERVWSKLLKGDKSSYSLSANVRKDGKIITCEWFNALLRDASGNVSGVLSMAHDVTEKRELERQLQTAQRMEAVGTLAGGIAHDFNNALTGIMGFGELVRLRLAGNSKSAADLDEIQRCAERAATLTRQLLTFARRQVIDPVNLDLSALVADLMRLIGKVVGEHIEVITSLEKNVPTIHADRGQIEQVVMNLCLNSRDAMPGGGRLVVETGDVYLDKEYVRLNPYMRTGRYALLMVSDTGVGMDEKTCERVFEPFFTTKGPEKGTGLGLSMVYGIVKQHGGFIHLYSEPGKGTAFKVYFPAIEAQPDAVPAIRREEIVRGGMETILLAEDEDAIRSLGERALKELGYTVLVARNGEEAVEIYRQHKEIVLAVLDIIMPRKGGKEAFEEMHKQNPRLKVIFMSGYSANAFHDSFVLIAGIPFLQKPFGPNALARKVREVLDGK